MKIIEDMELCGNCMIAPIYSMKSDKDAFTVKEMDMLSKMHNEKIIILEVV